LRVFLIWLSAQLILGSGKKAQKVEISREQRPRNNSQEKQPEVKPIEAPAGLDLHPKPQTSVQVSKRVGVVVGIEGIGLLLAYAYGGYRRQARTQASAQDANLPKAVMPATASASEVEKAIPSGNAPLVKGDPNQLQPPGAVSVTARPASTPASCGFDPRTGQLYRFNPIPGNPARASNKPAPKSANLAHRPFRRHRFRQSQHPRNAGSLPHIRASAKRWSHRPESARVVW
jgi:hypothetical protein